MMDLSRYSNKQIGFKLESRKEYGNRCFVCNCQFPDRLSGKWFELHEIHGRKHPKLPNLEGINYILEHQQDFVPLCSKCHAEIHRLKKKAKTVSDVKKLLELGIILLQNSP
jgi:predicted HNH restriction endonuclease